MLKKVITVDCIELMLNPIIANEFFGLRELIELAELEVYSD